MLSSRPAIDEKRGKRETETERGCHPHHRRNRAKKPGVISSRPAIDEKRGKRERDSEREREGETAKEKDESEKERKRERQSEKEKDRERDQKSGGNDVVKLPPMSPPQPCQKAGRDIVTPGHRRKERGKRERPGEER